MVFSTSSFLFLFLPATVIGYFLAHLICEKLTNAYLFIVSLVFYCWNGTSHVMVLLFSIISNYTFALLIQHSIRNRWRRIFLLSALCVDLGLLGYYKYSGFLLSNYSLLVHSSISIPQIALPIGISFYTFQAMSYVIDVYKGAGAIRNPIDLGMYITFFPQLIAGPIVRYGEIKNYFYNRHISLNDCTDGALRFLTGLCKNVILANNLGALADIVFNGKGLSDFSVLMLWLAAIAFMLQLYYDFSGYSDMAIGLGLLFGFRFPENFNYPYAASSVTDFWRRWHRTLSRWFRDYVYIPLGGSRGGASRHVLNLFIVWILTGFWHGAAWQFLFWGLFYFILLTVEKYMIRPEQMLSPACRMLYRIWTLLNVCILWVVFRSSSLFAALRMLSAMFCFEENPLFNASALFYLREYSFYLITGTLLSFPVFPFLRKKYPSFYIVFQSALLLIGTFVSISFIIKDAYNPFLYFQF